MRKLNLVNSFLISVYFYFYSIQSSPGFLDYAHPWQISFQDPATPVMEGIIALHHDLMFVLSIIGAAEHLLNLGHIPDIERIVIRFQAMPFLDQLTDGSFGLLP